MLAAFGNCKGTSDNTTIDASVFVLAPDMKAVWPLSDTKIISDIVFARINMRRPSPRSFLRR